MPWVYATAGDLESMSYNYYAALVSTTVLLYDFLLTFPEELERFWILRRPNCAVILFFLNRYLVIFGYLPVLVENFLASYNPDKLKMSVPDNELFNVVFFDFPVVTLYSCAGLQTYHQYFSLVIQFVVASVSILRMYALYRRNFTIFVSLVSFTVILLATGCWAAYGGQQEAKQEILTYVGCGVFMSRYRAIRRAAGWAAMFLFDLVIFGLTLYGILSLPRTTSWNFLSVFMRDGAMYFGLLTLSTMLNILILLLSEPLSKDLGMSFTNILSSVIMSRLMLNLRDPSLVLSQGRPTTEATTYPNLTDIETHYLTELSDRGGFGDDYPSRIRSP